MKLKKIQDKQTNKQTSKQTKTNNWQKQGNMGVTDKDRKVKSVTN